MPNCPECVAKERNAIVAKYEGQEDIDIAPMLDAVEIPMKMEPSTKTFICRRCGLYATREQIYDIRDRLAIKEKTRADKQYDYLEWWQKSKKDKQAA